MQLGARDGSSAPNGSSISRIGGSAASARATPTRCRWPPDSSSRPAASRTSAAGKADQRRAARPRARAMRAGSQPSSRGTTAMFSADGHVRKEPDLLEDVADPPAQLERIPLARVARPRPARRRASGTISRLIELEQRALAGAAAADEGDRLARGDVEVEPPRSTAPAAARDDVHAAQRKSAGAISRTDRRHPSRLVRSHNMRPEARPGTVRRLSSKAMLLLARRERRPRRAGRKCRPSAIFHAAAAVQLEAGDEHHVRRRRAAEGSPRRADTNGASRGRAEVGTARDPPNTYDEAAAESASCPVAPSKSLRDRRHAAWAGCTRRQPRRERAASRRTPACATTPGADVDARARVEQRQRRRPVAGLRVSQRVTAAGVEPAGPRHAAAKLEPRLCGDAGARHGRGLPMEQDDQRRGRAAANRRHFGDHFHLDRRRRAAARAPPRAGRRWPA